MCGRGVLVSGSWRRITKFLSERLRLTVNAAKSAVDRPWNRSFLGYTVTAHLQPRLRVAPRSIERLRDKLTVASRQGRGRSIDHTIKDLVPILRGWINYFRLVQVKGTFEDLDGWLRRKMRCILWRQWKRPRTRAMKLRQRGLEEARARQCGLPPLLRPVRRDPVTEGSSHMSEYIVKVGFWLRAYDSFASRS
jgi:hypothetical protein